MGLLALALVAIAQSVMSFSTSIIATALAIDATTPAISAGDTHTCIVTRAGAVKCWGRNAYGELGDGTTVDRGSAVDVIGLNSGAIAVAAGGSHTCALLADGAMKCWGSNYFGALGDGTLIDKSTPVAVVGLGSSVRAIAAGGGHTCAITTAGALKCWGENNYGQLGRSAVSGLPLPAVVTGLTSGVTAVTAGEDFTCALVDGGGVKCWGENVWGQVGNGTSQAGGTAASSAQATPVDVIGLASGVRNISSGGSHTCAVTTAGGVKCWGFNDVGQLGNSVQGGSSVPVDVVDLSAGVRAVASGGYILSGTFPGPSQDHTCALLIDGGVRCWGSGFYDQASDGSTGLAFTPVLIAYQGPAVLALAAGEHQTCALVEDDGVKCWGELGFVGDGKSAYRSAAATVAGVNGARSVSVADDHACALNENGGVVCWGGNSYGGLGDNGTATAIVPVDVFGLSVGVSAISAGPEFTCAVTTAGAVECWGKNSYGKLGDGTTTDRFAPVRVSTLAEVTSVTTGDLHACALTRAGGVKCWGYGNFIGDGETDGQPQPVPHDVSGLGADVIAISANFTSTCAVTRQGGVKCWGLNDTGLIADSSVYSVPTPIDVIAFGTDVTSITLGTEQACILTSQGAVKCWSGASRIPVTVIESGATSISSGYNGTFNYTCAVIGAGNVQCWDDEDDYGFVDNGTLTYRAEPTNAGGLTGVAAELSAGMFSACAVTTIGTVQCWGAAYGGWLGDGTPTSYPTPVNVLDGFQPLTTAIPVPSPVQLNQHGLSGTWYNPATSGEGFVVEEYPTTGQMTIGWFTYDTVPGGNDHQRWYVLDGGVATSSNTAAFGISDAYGGNLDAPPKVSASEIGRASLSLDSCANGRLDYSFADGRQGSIPVTRFSTNVSCTPSGTGTEPGQYLLSGNWYDPQTSGQGFQIDLDTTQQSLFAAWYTYSPDGAATNGPASQRWFTLQQQEIDPAATSFHDVPIFSTIGGIFDTPGPKETDHVGSADLVFHDCGAATLSYHFDDGENRGHSGSIELVRVGPAPPGCAM